MAFTVPIQKKINKAPARVVKTGIVCFLSKFPNREQVAVPRVPREGCPGAEGRRVPPPNGRNSQILFH